MLKNSLIYPMLWNRVIYANKNEPRFIYLNKPKCGCQTIHKILTLTENFYHNKNYIHTNNMRHLLKSPFHHDINKMEHKHFIFTIVRNPYMRIFSCYRDKFFSKNEMKCITKIKKSIPDWSFESFLNYINNRTVKERNPHWLNQSILHPVQIDCNYVGSIENFDKSMEYIINKIYGNELNYVDFDDKVIKNTKSHKFSHEGYFTKTTIKLIQKIYQDDFEMFGYSKDINKMFDPPKIYQL